MKAKDIKLTEWESNIIHKGNYDIESLFNWREKIDPDKDQEFISILTSRELFCIRTKQDLLNLATLMDKLGANCMSIHYDKDYNNWIELLYQRSKQELIDIKIKKMESELLRLKSQRESL